MSERAPGGAIERWAAAALPIALLLTGEQASAERATIDAVARAVAHGSEDALWAALLRHAPAPLHAALPRRALPPSLRRVAPLDRALLGLWLLRGWDGARIAAAAHSAPDVLLPRIHNAIDRIDPDALPDDPDDQTRWKDFIARQLGFAPATLSQRTPPAWAAAIDDARSRLRDAVARQRPTPALLAAIADRVDDAEQPPPWRRWLPWLLPLLGGALLVALITAPGDASPILPQAPPTAREVVEQSLSAWLTLPVTGTLHRRVVAYDTRLVIDEPLTTDVWLSAGSERHRIEVRHGDKLVEWQIGDGTKAFDYGATPSYSSCRWTQNGVILDDVSRSFELTPQQQQAARSARLQLGAYGEGYRALDRARTANDLRSFGIRTENNQPRLLLGYTDRRPPERTILLSIDPQTNQLWAVREVASAGSRATVRDLWRLETDEADDRPVSVTPPEWSQVGFVRDRLLDPACPGLDVDRVMSLRSLPIGVDYYGISWLPPSLPDGTTKAALISSSVLTYGGFGAPGDVQAIFSGPDRWLSMQQSGASATAVNSDRADEWSVSFRDPAASGLIDALAIRPGSDPHRFMPAYRITARGWTQQEVIAFVDSLQPIDQRAWIELGDAFLDPQPLDPPVADVLQRAMNALEPREGTLYAAFALTSPPNRDLPVRPDPYSLPLDVLYPGEETLQSWHVVSGTQISRSKKIRRNGSTLLSASFSDGPRWRSYSAVQGQALIGTGQTWKWSDYPLTEAHTMLRQLLQTGAPITLTEQADGWLLEQPAPEVVSSWDIQRVIARQNRTARPPDDAIVRRVWLDRDTFLPRRSELAYNVAPFTTLRVVERTAWQWIATPPDEFWQLPPIPPETLTMAPMPDGGGEQIVQTGIKLAFPRRVLAWPPGPDVASIQTSTRIEIPSTPTLERMVVSEQLQEHLWESFASFSDNSGLVSTTRYEFVGQQAPVIVRQGPRDILRHVLRYGSREQEPDAIRWNSSTPLTATIDGQPREAWLIDTDASKALLVEVDDVLLHISGPSADELRNVTLPMLPRLAWQDVPVAGPYLETDSQPRTITPPPVVPTAVPPP